MNKAIEYFDTNFSKWNIVEFLEFCASEPFDFDTIIHRYLSKLEAISKSDVGPKAEKARTFLNQYKSGTQPDRKLAKTWIENLRDGIAIVSGGYDVIKKSAPSVEANLGKRQASFGEPSSSKKVNLQRSNSTESDSSSDSSIFVQGETLPNPFLGEEEEEEEEEGAMSDDEDQVDVGCLNEPHVIRNGSGKGLTMEEWSAARERVKALRLKLSMTKCLFNPLFYYIINHTGQHGPTADLFELQRMRLTLSDDVVFTLPELSPDHQFFDALITADDLDNVRATTPEQKTVKRMVSNILDSITNEGNKFELTGMEHLCRNLMPLMDATVRRAPQLRVSYGERILNATAVRRNKERDPENRARAGYKVDVIVEFLGLHWMPEIGCGEVSGGLPCCSRAKECIDVIKLAWGLRDMWALAQEQLVGVDASALVVWGFTVVGMNTGWEIRIYSLSAAGGLFHLVLAYQAPMPSARTDIWNIQLAYCVMLSKLNQTQMVM